MKDQPVDQRILQILSQLTVLQPAQIKPADRLREDLGLDSVSSMELLSMLAEEFDLDIEPEEAIRVTTVAGTIEMAEQHLRARAS